MGERIGDEILNLLMRLRAVAWLLTFALPTLVWASGAAAEPVRVLMLFSNDSLLPAGATLGDSFRNAIESESGGREVDIFTEFLDADRFPEAAHAARMASLLRDKYSADPIDLVVSVGPQALAFLRERRTTLFPNAPLVFAAVSEASIDRPGMPSNSTGVISRFDAADTLELALRLQPHATRVTVVTGASVFDRQWEAVAREQLAPYADRLDVTYLAGLTLPRLLDALAGLPPTAIALYLTIFEDGAGELFTPRDLVQRLSDAAGAPLYGVYEPYVGRGAVGGFVESFEAMGAATARLTARVLAGESPESLPPDSVATQAYTVDWRQVRRWGLDEASLPAGTSIRFREPSLWALYRTEILGVLVFILMQSIFIVALLVQRRQRRLAEASLRESEERYRDVVDTQTELICRYRPDTTLTFVNDAYCRYFDRGRDALVGQSFLQLVPEADRAVVLKEFEDIGRRGRSETYEHQVLRPDGSLGWQQWTDRVIHDEAGAVAEIQGIGRDITDIKHADLEVARRRQEVTHLTRVAILGELSGALAHELNQPLTAILSNAQAAQRLLVRNLPDLTMVAEILDDIVTDDRRAGDVIARLRALLQRGESRFEPVGLNVVATDVLALVWSELIERRVVVETHLAAALPLVQGDRVQLQQVLLNLVINACEAMSDNGPVDRTVTVTTSLDGDGVVQVSVTDRGSGIPPDAAERLFEPFFTTKPNGLGLGLSICRSIMTAHGGSLSAAENADRGSTFTLVLPVSRGDPR